MTKQNQGAYAIHRLTTPMCCHFCTVARLTKVTLSLGIKRVKAVKVQQLSGPFAMGPRQLRPMGWALRLGNTRSGAAPPATDHEPSSLLTSNYRTSIGMLHMKINLLQDASLYIQLLGNTRCFIFIYLLADEDLCNFFIIIYCRCYKAFLSFRRYRRVMLRTSSSIFMHT